MRAGNDLVQPWFNWLECIRHEMVMTSYVRWIAEPRHAQCRDHLINRVVCRLSFVMHHASWL